MAMRLLNEFPDIGKIENKIHTRYPTQIKNQVDSIIEDINDEAIKRVHLEGITIDDILSPDLDDGIWVEKRTDGGYTLFVSIADVAEVIKPYTPCHLEALKRTTSLYLRTHIIHMFHQKISTDICSLNDKVNTLTLTIQIDLDSQFNTLNTNIFESVFFNKKRFCYASFNDQLNNPESEFNGQILLLNKVASGLYSKRSKNTNLLDYNESDRSIGKNINSGSKGLASFIVRECMIRANIETEIYKIKNEIRGLSRNHMPDYKGENPKELENAYYSPEMLYHLGLREDYYTHFTSPIRRLADLINHRLIKEFLNNKEYTYVYKELELIARRINFMRFAYSGLEKEQNYGSKATKKLRGKKKENGEILSSEIINHIKICKNNGYKIPKYIINEIKNTIDNSYTIPDWIINHILPHDSKSKEMVILKEKVKEWILKDTKVTRYLGILGNISGLKIEQTIDNNSKKININFSISVTYNSKNIIYRKGKYNAKGVYGLRKYILGEIIDHLIEN